MALDAAAREAVDKALQRLVRGSQLRHIDRGLYDLPRTNRLTKRPAVADYRHIVDAVARRDQVRMLDLDVLRTTCSTRLSWGDSG